MKANSSVSPVMPKCLIGHAHLAHLAAAMLYSASLLVVGGQTNYQRLMSFGFPDQEHSGSYPQSPLIKGSDGKFYGTTSMGGASNAGTIFKLNPDGSGYVVLRHFTGSGGDGSGPGSLIEGNDGELYGTTQNGGTGLCSGGIIFKLNKDGHGYAVLRSLDGCGGSPPYPAPAPRVIQGSDLALYGTTGMGGTPGGTNSVGAVFRLNNDGSGYTTLHIFTNLNDGAEPAALTQGSDGALYGAAMEGGSSGLGTLFKMNQDGSDFTILHNFIGTNGSFPQWPLVEGSDGRLYGTTQDGGMPICSVWRCFGGTVFSVEKDGGSFEVLHTFTRIYDEDTYQGPRAGLVQGNDGALYGATSGGTVFKLENDGSGYVVLHYFPSSNEDGAGPQAPVQGSDGALYGTTTGGGDLGAGTVFKLFSSPPVVALTGIELSAAGVRLSVAGGAAGQTVRIEAKTKLNASLWEAIATSQFDIDGKFQFLDATASNYPTRFYHSVTP